jgi:hypothetical protein
MNADLPTRIEAGEATACRGCGSTMTRAELNAGGWLNCCPERAMNEVIEARHGTPALIRATETENG